MANTSIDLRINSVADPGFPIGGCGPSRGGLWTPEALRFKNFTCQNERIWTRRGGHVPGVPPLDLPMQLNRFLALHALVEGLGIC